MRASGSARTFSGAIEAAVNENEVEKERHDATFARKFYCKKLKQKEHIVSIQTVYQLSVICGGVEVKLNPKHELVLLAERIDWVKLTEELAPYYSLLGRMAKSLRLMIGLHILKHRFNLSDREVVRMLSENIYWRWFCGLHNDMPNWSEEKPLDASSLTKFRRRIKEDGMKVIEKVINGQLFQEGRIDRKTQVIDTTAMEKNIAYPVDSHLLDRGMKRIVRKVNRLKKIGLSVHVRSFARLARKQILLMNKLGRGRTERIERGNRKMVKYAKEVLKQARPVQNARKKSILLEETQRLIDRIKEQIKEDTELLEKVIFQTERRLEGEHVKGKILSFHEPDVTVIAKGKRGKRYEFGAKVSLSRDRNGYVVGHQEYHENIADVNSLDAAVKDWAQQLGEYPEELAADRGYHTSNPSDVLSLIKTVSIPTRGKKKHPDHNKPYFRRLQRQRNKIEPTIGHLKTDHRMNRCRYKGKSGDTHNVAWAALAWNLKKWVREIEAEMDQVA